MNFFQNEEDRLLCEINNAKSDLADLQRNIVAQIIVPSSTTNSSSSQNGSVNSDGQSRLQQWKKTNNIQGHQQEDNSLNSLSLSINSGGFFDDKGIGNDWKSGALDWSPPNTYCGSINGLDNSGYEINSHEGYHLKKSGKIFVN